MIWFLLKVLQYASFALVAPFWLGFVVFGIVGAWAHDKACDIEDRQRSRI